MTGMITVFNLRLAAGLTRKQNLFGTLCFILSDKYNDLLHFLSKCVGLVSFLSLICKHKIQAFDFCLFCHVGLVFFKKKIDVEILLLNSSQ